MGGGVTRTEVTRLIAAALPPFESDQDRGTRVLETLGTCTTPHPELLVAMTCMVAEMLGDVLPHLNQSADQVLLQMMEGETGDDDVRGLTGTGAS